MIRFIRTPAALEAATRQLGEARSIALDTEFHSERHYHPQLMLLQLRGDEGEALLVDPLAGLDLAPLAEVLTRVPVIVHGGTADVAILQRALGVRVAVAFDTQVAAGFAGLGYPVRLQELTRHHLGLHLAKGETLSDWSRRPLTDAQARYAADDVLVLGALERALRAEVEARGNSERLRACTDEILARAVEPEVDDDAWRSVAGAVALDGEERAALRVLAAWRQSEARARDIPRHSVVPDALLVDLARRRPGDIAGIQANRRVPTNVWKREGPAILSCLQRARDAADPGPLHARPRAWMDLVRAAGRLAERRTGIASELLLPDRLLAAGLGGIEPWRRAALGDEFWSFVQGRAAISLPDDWRDFAVS